jgi:Spy/CpxP family protein refolding chaperone
MNTENRNRWQIRAATLSIFLLGALAGGFAMNAYNLWFGGAPPQLSRAERLQKLARQLELNEAQTNEVQQIFSDTREKIQALRQETREEMNGKLQKVLTPEQWQKLLQIREAKKEEEKQRNSEMR